MEPGTELEVENIREMNGCQSMETAAKQTELLGKAEWATAGWCRSFTSPERLVVTMVTMTTQCFMASKGLFHASCQFPNNAKICVIILRSGIRIGTMWSSTLHRDIQPVWGLTKGSSTTGEVLTAAVSAPGPAHDSFYPVPA